jgi:hypothetical protein
MNSESENNELLQWLIENIQDAEQALEMFNCVAPYMQKNFGETGITINNLLFIPPAKLYKVSVSGSTTYFKDFVQLIMMYKITNGLDVGFTMKQYENLFNTNIQYENIVQQKRMIREQHQVKRMEEKLAKLKRQEAIVKTENFDMSNIVTKDSIIKHIKEMYNGNVTFYTKTTLSNFCKNLFNYKIGSLTYNNPFKINSIKDASVYWIGYCKCGNFRVTQGGRINDHTDCGRCGGVTNKYVGTRMGHLVCTEQKYILSQKKCAVLNLKCKCDCGSEIILTAPRFTGGSVTNCGVMCKYAIEARNEAYKNQGDHFKPIFHKDTNIAKIGRTSTNRNSSTGYLGVTYMQSWGKYMSYIVFQKKQEILGYYNTPEEAYKVRMFAQNMLHSQFLSEMEVDPFVQNNKYLKQLLEKLKLNVAVSIQEMRNTEE